MRTFWILMIGLCVGACGGPQAGFKEAFDRVISVGRGELAENEQQGLAQDWPTLAGQMQDPATRRMIEVFAALPDRYHQMLLDKGYLKWSFSDVPASLKESYREWVTLNVTMVRNQGKEPNANFSLAALEKASVGFAVVAGEGLADKVVSIFILWPDLPDPTWATLVNARFAGSPAYFQAHLKALNGLRTKPNRHPQ